MSNLRILVADDHDIIRRGLMSLLSSRPGWMVCAEAATGREAVTLAEQHRPDIVVMDISMPDLNGLEAARKIRKQLPKTEVVVLSLHRSEERRVGKECRSRWSPYPSKKKRATSTSHLRMS